MVKKPWPIGIDFGSHAVRMVQLEGGGDRLRVAVRDCHVYPSRPRKERPHPEEMIEAVRAILRRHRFRGRRAVTALPVRDLMVKNIRLPKMPEEELNSAVRFEAMERMVGLDEGAEIRFIPAGMLPGRGDAQHEVIVFASPGTAVREHLAMIQELGLEPAGIDVPSLAALRPFLRHLRRDQDRERVTALADVGRSSMCFTIARGSEVTFTKFFELGAEKIDWDQLGKEMSLCLRYYAVTFRGQRPDGVICIGGEARDASALEHLTQAAGTPCRMGQPLLALEGNDEGSLKGEDSLTEWAMAAGLALKPVNRRLKAAAA